VTRLVDDLYAAYAEAECARLAKWLRASGTRIELRVGIPRVLDDETGRQLGLSETKEAVASAVEGAADVLPCIRCGSEDIRVAAAGDDSPYVECVSCSLILGAASGGSGRVRWPNDTPCECGWNRYAVISEPRWALPSGGTILGPGTSVPAADNCSERSRCYAASTSLGCSGELRKDELRRASRHDANGCEL
jgi:hypothetical protein